MVANIASILLQRIAGDGSERWHLWFWGCFALFAIGGAGYYLVRRWQLGGGDF